MHAVFSEHLEVSTAPTFTSVHPVSLQSLKQQLSIPDVAEYDSMLGGLVETATNTVQERLGIQIPAATYKHYRNSFSDWMELRRPPVNAVSAVTYLDSNGDETVLATTVYRTIQLGLRRQPAVVTLDYNQTWPTTLCVPRSVWITFTCGYASGSVPADVQQLLTLMVMQEYFGRDNTREMAIEQKIQNLRWQW